MNLVDSCGWIEYMADGPNARFYTKALLDPEGPKNLILPSICLQEVFRLSLREQGPEKADNVASFMKSRAMVVPHDSALAVESAALGQRYKLALADSIVYATALAFGARLWTQDSAFKGLPGVEFNAK